MPASLQICETLSLPLENAAAQFPAADARDAVRQVVEASYSAADRTADLAAALRVPAPASGSAASSAAGALLSSTATPRATSFSRTPLNDASLRLARHGVTYSEVDCRPGSHVNCCGHMAHLRWGYS